MYFINKNKLIKLRNIYIIPIINYNQELNRNNGGYIMQQNYFQRLEMQISQENINTGLENSLNYELEKLSKKYNLRRVNELKEYIVKDEMIIPYINSITPLIMEYFPDNKRYLTYCTDPEFEELSKAKICIIGNDSLFEEERELMSALNDEILYLKNYSTHVKNLISVRLWWL